MSNEHMDEGVSGEESEEKSEGEFEESEEQYTCNLGDECEDENCTHHSNYFDD